MAELIQMAQDFLSGSKNTTNTAGNTSARSNKQSGAQPQQTQNTRGNSQQSGHNVSDGANK